MTRESGALDAATVAAAEAAVDAVAAAWAVPGVAVAVTDRDGLVWQRVSGVADLSRGLPLRADHLLEIGSISKAATAMVVLQSVRAGLLALDQPIRTVLPWIPAALQGDALTLRRLLNHTGGLVGSVDALADERAQIAGYAGEGGATTTERFHYSNVGFLLLGLAAAAVNGRPLPELVRERVFAPAGMRDAVAAIVTADAGRLATGHQPRVDDRPWRPGDPLVAAPFVETAGSDGSIAATAADVAAFARVLLRGGRGDHGEVLDAASFAAMTGLRAPGGEDVLVVPGQQPPAWSRYGLGINVEQGPRGDLLSHGGGMVGFASFLLADPAAGRAVVVLTNADGDSPVAEAIARSVAVAFDGGAPAREPAGLDPLRWGSPARGGPGGGDHLSVRPPAMPAGAVGVFTRQDGHALEVRRSPSGSDSDSGSGSGSGSGFEVVVDGEAAALEWTWTDRCVTALPSLRRFALVFDGAAWTWGGDVFTRGSSGGARAAAVAPSGIPADLLDAAPGHYRSYTPWYPHFRVVRRGDRLVLIAPRGVEAPAEDQELVLLGDGRFRVGADRDAPETLRFGPTVDGGSVWADRDGCRYSRAFTD